MHGLRAVVLAVVVTLASAGGRADDLIGEVQTYTTRYEDTLLDIARTTQLGLIELMAANPGVDPWLPGEGRRIILPTAHVLPDAPRQGIVVNLAELRLYFFPAGDGPVTTFPIGVGREGAATPLGATKIVRKKKDPAWYPPKSIRDEDPELPSVVPPGPDNPLGQFALYLGWPAYLIHGTHQPWGVGRRVSHGCIRLYPESIEWLFGKVPVGTPVTVVKEPVKLGRRNGELYLQVHPSLAQVDQIETEGIPDPEPAPERADPDRILLAAGDQIWRLDWNAITWALHERQGLPIRITR